MQASRGVKALGPFSCKAAMLPFPAGGRLLCPLRFSVSGFSRVRLRRSLPVRSGLLSRPRPWLWSFGAPTRHPPCTPPRADLLNSARAAQATTTHRRPLPAARCLGPVQFWLRSTRPKNPVPLAAPSRASLARYSASAKGPFPLDGPQPTYAPPPLHHQLPTQTLQRLHHRPWLKSA